MIIKFNKVYILESLPKNELKTGKNLYEELFHHNSQEDNFEYGFEYEVIKNSLGLNTMFDIIKMDIEKYNILPVIHFEMHGDEEGITLGSGEIVGWESLMKHLENINILLKNKLFVVFAFCHGIQFLSRYYNFMYSRTPFSAVISAADEIKAGELQKGFPLFYKTLIYNQDGMLALQKLNSVIDNPNRHFSFLSCLWLFKAVFIEYLKECSAKRVNKRTNNIINNIHNPNVNIKDARKKIKAYLHKNNQKPEFEKFREQFLMYDLDKSNIKIFSIEFEDILQEVNRINN